MHSSQSVEASIRTKLASPITIPHINMTAETAKSDQNRIFLNNFLPD